MSIRFVTVFGTGLVLWAIVSGQYVHALQFLRGISTGTGYDNSMRIMRINVAR